MFICVVSRKPASSLKPPSKELTKLQTLKSIGEEFQCAVVLIEISLIHLPFCTFDTILSYSGPRDKAIEDCI